MKENDKKKKDSKESKKSIKNRVEINPELKETAVFAFGRFNPVTTGHELVVEKIHEIAEQQDANPYVFASHSHDNDKNPLSYGDKIDIMQEAFGDIVQRSEHRNVISILKSLDENHDRIVMVAGSDRVTSFYELLNKYNGSEYQFESIEVVSAGERENSISASDMREYVRRNNFEEFKVGLPDSLEESAEIIFEILRESLVLEENERKPLTFAQRRQRGRIMKKFARKIAAARKRRKNRKADKDRLKGRAQKKAIQMVRKKVASKKGKDYGNLTAGEKSAIDKRVQKRTAEINRFAKKMLPKLRKAEAERMRGKKPTTEQISLDDLYELQEATKTADILNKAIEVIHKYVSDGADLSDISFQVSRAKGVDYSAADLRKKYKEAFGEVKKSSSKDGGKALRSKYLKMDMAIEEASKNDEKPKKRFHELLKKDGTVKYDKRFKFNKKECTEEELIPLIDEIYESVILDEKKSDAGLEKKAQESGISKSILKQVYDRGLAAYRQGHRPGTTAQQWAYARVNSFISGGKTRSTADKDLWDKHKGN